MNQIDKMSLFTIIYPGKAVLLSGYNVLWKNLKSYNPRNRLQPT